MGPLGMREAPPPRPGGTGVLPPALAITDRMVVLRLL